MEAKKGISDSPPTPTTIPQTVQQHGFTVYLMFGKTLNIVLIPSMLVKWFIDLQSPRKIDVITCCKTTDATSVHNGAYPLLIFDEETYFLGWFNF